jgi:NAD(P)-dependent dehydrogenase (short-subunit alcohol dehydrogenase family)
MVIFLTGGSGGIGQSIKQTLEDQGVTVVAPTSKELNLKQSTDVSQYPEIDGLIHCAGVNPISLLSDLRLSDASTAYNINTLSFIELCAKLKLKPNANVIAIGSLYATGTREGRLSYTMSKHALLGAVKTIALELAQKQIKVNMISPGFVDTPLTRKNNTKERIDALQQMIPLGLVNPCEIANLCLYLIKHNNSITGQNFIVDGGYSIKGL